jgi:hypothetical protein
MQIDRMALADLGNSVSIARAVLSQLGDIEPPVPIDDIAAAAGISDIQVLQTTGFEGALITDDCKGDGIILVNARSRPERRRFTIGHELGHFLNPWHKPPSGGFKCKKEDMLVRAHGGNAQIRMEVEANLFSAEMLMPEKIFRRDLNKLTSPGLEHIVELADSYETSKLATARRFVDLHDEPTAIVLSKNGAIDQIYWHKEFPYFGLRSGQVVPARSLTALFADGAGCSNNESAEPALWLQNPLPPGANMYEQVLVQSGGYRITLLTIDRNECDDEDDNYTRERSEWSPRFR